ncbi:MAG: PspA/IM30 family protein [Lachnospiraceae bacterium]|nr:PspA/IM30 family protein [Lachnospiraceae bacterium]
MGMLERFNDIVKSNITAIMDKFEDPEKMVEQYLIDLTEDLTEVKEETAAVMAEETRCKKAVADNEKAVEKYVKLAKAALEAGNEGDARIFLAKKNELEAHGANLQAALEAAKVNAEKMRQLHDKLVSDIESLKVRKEAIKSKVSVAKTQERVNKYADAAEKYAGKMGAFERMEAKADQMLNKANAMDELNKSGDKVADLESKYAVEERDEAVEADLAALKAELGL